MSASSAERLGLAVDPARVDHHQHDEQQSLHRGQHPVGMHKHQPVRHRELQRDGHRGGQRDRPPQLALGAPLPRRDGACRVHGRPGAGVHPLARRVHALRLEPLRDQPVQFVDPLVQRTDPVDDLGRRVFVAHAAHASAGYRRSCRPPVRAPPRAGPSPPAGVGGRLKPVGQPVERVEPVHARPPRGLGLPGPAPVPDPGQRRQRRRLAEHQVGQRPPGQVGGGDAVPGVPAGPAKAGRGVVRHRGAPVARHAEHAAPGVRDLSRGGRGEHPPQHRGQRGHGRRVGLAQVVHGRAVPVGHAAPAERDPAVRGALRVHVRVGLVGQRLAAVPADLLPGRRRERLGHDHVAVHRQQRPPQPGQRGGIPLGAAQHRARPHVAELRPGDCAAGRRPRPAPPGAGSIAETGVAS